MSITGRLTSLVATVLVVLAACAPATPAGTPPRAQSPADQPSAPAQPAARKTITFGVTGNIRSFSLSEVGSGGAGRALTELWIQGLVTSGMKTQAPEARIAAEVPSVDRGSMRVESDGTMTVTWKIRPDVKWADGTA